ncbi:crotonase/enoyl-CoA hydratase family protein [Azospirillum sp. CT11-132]|jgi:enoyl-CoA hydratase/carnithine racemase|uniref:crotonase/enoyl-CoA hydratase family protein n=1 Tax=unclassified Azospirillum TaxID=2630922 RepID=UPI000D61EE56|nr:MULTISPECIES: crotonase/enoyl-CoA hydratase family protein [unclassified Azospirillum]PWC59276.1 enoyl-CoA hydratase [Azospirillum sp. TSH7]PWC60063.1 enoyl-CoA hydratase [Azospirillum sp. TSH20]
MTDAVLEENADGIVTLTLNRPEQRNPISDDDVLETLIAALARLDADNATRAIIITGAGSAFSSGGNLKKMGASGGLNDPLPAQTRLNYRRGIQRLPLLIEAMEVPTIAAVNGPAVGAGCDLACMCDLRIAGESARFAESFVKVGIVPGDGGAWFLPRVVGFSKACEMALTGDAIDAREALACGLVSRVVPDTDLLAEARALAARIAANPPHAVRMTRRLLRQGRNADLDSLLEMSAAMQALAHATDDHREAVASLLERRDPHFTGR